MTKNENKDRARGGANLTKKVRFRSGEMNFRACFIRPGPTMVIFPKLEAKFTSPSERYSRSRLKKVPQWKPIKVKKSRWFAAAPRGCL